MTVINKRRKQNKTQVEKHELELVDLLKVPEKNAKEIQECENKVEKLTKQKTDLEEELQKNYSQFENETKPLISEREKLETELIDLKIHVDDAKAEVALSESELKILKHDEITETRKYETMKTSYEESEYTLKEQRNQLEETKNRLPEIHKEIAATKNKVQKLQQDEEIMRGKLMTLRAEVILLKRKDFEN